MQLQTNAQYASICINMLQSASIPLPSYFSTGRCYFSLMHNMHQYASIPYLVTSRQMRLQTQCTQCTAHRPGHGVPTSKNFEHVKCLICEPASCHIFICQWLSCSLTGKYKTAKEVMKTTNNNLYYAGPWKLNLSQNDISNQCSEVWLI